MSGDVERLAEVLGEIRVAGAREADWWTSDEEHALLIQVLKAECVPWAEGLLASDWLARREAAAAAEALREAADALERMYQQPGSATTADWLRRRARGREEAGT
jgi:hypothetical protein